MGSTGTESTPGRKKSVLVVEDDETTRTLIVRALSATYEVHDAIDGLAAQILLDKLSKSPPDVIICDLMMPNMNGVELTKKVKAESSPLKRVPILMLTAKGDAQSKIKGISAGAKHYMTKPFSVKELMDRVAKMVGT